MLLTLIKTCSLLSSTYALTDNQVIHVSTKLTP